MTQLLPKLKQSTAAFLMLLTLFTVAPVAAQAGARVFLQPVSTTADTITVDVIADNVTDLYGVEFLVTYDPAIVAVADVRSEQDGVQINAGTLLPVDQGFVVANQANPAAGTVSFAMTLLNPAPAVSGSGSLAQITFKRLQPSPTTIDIADVKLVGISLQIIPAETTGLTLNADGSLGSAASAEGVANESASPFPWWIVAAGIIILGLIALGAFLALGGLSNPAAVSVIDQPVQRPARSRPSAFK